MGDDVIRRESSTHNKILKYAMLFPIFTKVGCLNCFLKMSKFNNAIERRFATTLESNEAMVKVFLVDASKVSIAQVFCFARIGADFPLRVDVVATREEFCE